MRVCFWHSDKPRERFLSEAFLEGVKKSGDEVERRSLGTPIADTYDVAAMVGVKSAELFNEHRRRGIRVLMFDKGYARHSDPTGVHGWEYWRIAVNAHHPTAYLMKTPRASERWDRLGFEVLPWRHAGEHILFAGSSAKYHNFYGLKEPTTYAAKVVRRFKPYTQRPIWYRPKPSWRDAVPIDGTRFTEPGENIFDALKGAYALVTHGSNACFEAMLMGIPCLILGEAVAKVISSTAIEDIENLRIVSDEERKQVLYNLAYQQFTLSEMVSGEAWATVRPHVYG